MLIKRLTVSDQMAEAGFSSPALLASWTKVHGGGGLRGRYRELLKLMSIESVMPSSHLIPCRPLLLPPIPPSIRVFPMSQLFA